MTKQTPTEILREFLKAVDLTREVDGVYIPSHDKDFFDWPLKDALAALDDYYRAKYVALLPKDKDYTLQEHNTLAGTLERLALQHEEIGYNKALDDMRHRMEGNDE